MLIEAERESIVGDADGPTFPFPFLVEGEVVRGFQRGSKELGIPTANFPQSVVDNALPSSANGIYYGWSSVQGGHIFPMVMSIGWNPYYKNEKRSAEVHIIHEFPEDFYGQLMRVVVCGYIRTEKDYVSKDALIEDIHFDIKVALNSLDRPAYQAVKDMLLSTKK